MFWRWQRRVEVDFSPQQRRQQATGGDGINPELLEAERKRWTRGGGGAGLSSQIEWIKDATTGTERPIIHHALGVLQEKQQLSRAQHAKMVIESAITQEQQALTQKLRE